ncbi:PadR family transcriptional regulator [Devosia insulae DS-56]|uniref:PadR family transcriptional regulator n=1 Tax=Devosia insulae DS-56 TaxID=1116389 RepID=A0A1E5XTZ3_9HYPH|nr:PadR family transcriptional regulator [Devosia insulae]OEO32075.1 PadR family transcriptional regulator [Devosia insulae DS-56]
MSNITRLVVLGAVRQFEPVHGYFLRRELMTWHVDEWANIQPGSIYNALKSLKQDGYIQENGTEAAGKRPERTIYQTTPNGVVELMRLLRQTLWTVETFDTKPVMALTSFMFLLSRAEVVAALKVRIAEIDAKVASNGFDISDVAKSSTTPAYVREIFELSSLRLRAEQEWARGLYDRILAGAYTFADEIAAGTVARDS